MVKIAGSIIINRGAVGKRFPIADNLLVSIFENRNFGLNSGRISVTNAVFVADDIADFINNIDKALICGNVRNLAHHWVIEMQNGRGVNSCRWFILFNF